MSKSIVIIPTYNEFENISILLNKIINLSVFFHVLIVDDNSPDGTAKVVNEYTNTYKTRIFLESRIKKEGLGKAYTHGFNWALDRDYNYIFEMDADLSHNPEDLVRMQNELDNSNCDVIIGSRYVKGINVINWPVSRIILSYGASVYSRIITGLPVYDATAGFVGYKKEVLHKIDLKSILFNGYAYQIELKFKAYKNNFRILEIPIVFKDRIHGKSKMNGNIIFEAVFGLIKLKILSYFYKNNKK